MTQTRLFHDITHLRKSQGARRYTTRERQDAYIQEHYLDMTNKEMAAHLGVTPAAVKARMATLGLNRQSRRDETWQRVLDLKAQGLGPKAIAAATGRSVSTIDEMLIRARKEHITAPPARKKSNRQNDRDALESRTPEGEIRRMYAAKQAGLPTDTPLKSIPGEYRGPALAQDIKGAYLLDYEVVIRALLES